MKLKRKTLGLAYILILAIGTILSLYIPKNEVTASEQVVIPKEAIRLRILANSDLEADQALKRLVRDEVNANITKWVQELTDIKEARSMLQSKLSEVQAIAEAVVEREGSTQSVNVEFGKVQFPTKLYGQFLYPAGEYEAILITLGEGKGANWWCVLFPPLCFLDFSNGLAVSDGFEEKARAKEQLRTPETVTTKTVEESKQVQVKKTNQEKASVQVNANVKEETLVKEGTQEEVETQIEVETQKEVETQEVVEVQEKTEAPKKVKEPFQEVQPIRAPKQPKEVQPVYVSEEQDVEVRFFLKELWLRLF